MPFHNPYHFVPVKTGSRSDDLSVSDFENGKVGQVTHDRFVSKAGLDSQAEPVYSGRLICRLVTEDPIVIGAQREESQEGSPARVSPFELDGRPVIPASTLRGLISSIAEAASNSALRILENRPFSYRARMEESLPALGMIVRENDRDGKQILKLRPLSLPPLRWNSQTQRGEIPSEYRAMFLKPQLKVYIDGYRRKVGSQPPEVELSPRSFLQQANPDSYSADRQAFWYLKLAGFCSLEGYTISVTAPHVSHGRLLGQQAAADAKPISEAVYQKLSPEEQNQYTRGLLRVLGIDRRTSDIPITKKHEIFIPYPPEMETAPTFEVEDAIKIFQDLAAERTVTDPTLPFHLQGSHRNTSSNPENQQIKLRPGDLLFFKPAGNKVGEVAISSIWRRRAGGSSYDYFRKLSPEILPLHKDRQQLTIAEQLFGFVEQRARGQMNICQTRALASRLRFSFALLHGDQNNLYEEEILLKVLDSPKPPSPALYFKRRDGRGDYIAKSALNPAHHVPQGRKFYLHRLGNTGTPWQTLAPTENLKQKSYVQPLKAGLGFYFHVDFENLSRRELAMLCYAMRPTEQFRHKIGLGKPLGLGKVRIEPVGLFYVDRQARYQETSLFEAPRYHGAWLLMNEPPKAWPERYTLEKAAAQQELGQFPSFDTLRQSFSETMDPDIRTALELLGDPSKVRRAVHTPQTADTSGQEMEKETYRWFVANDLGSGVGDKKIAPQKKFLEPLSDSSTSLPTLPEHPWSG